MAEQKQLRGGTTAQHATFTGAEREVTVDTTKKTVVVHDGSTAGGIPLAKESALTAATANVPLTGYTIAEAAALPSSTDTINVAIGKLAKTASGHTSELSDITTHVNVKSFGATGDGTTDDISAIEDAIEYGLSNNIRNIYFPAGIYRVTRPINLNTYTSGETTIEHHYVRLFSEKAPHFNTADYNATILCDTGAGYAGIEAIDSVGITTENILLLLGTSTIGLLGGRGDEFKNATMQRYKTLFIYGASDHTKNNGLGTIGQICLEAEESSWESCNIYADLALVFARSGTIEKSTVGTDGLPNGTATFTFSSYYGVALVSNYSNYTYHFYGSNRFQSWAAYNPCILFAGDINDIDLGNAFFQLSPFEGVTTGEYGHVFEFRGNVDGLKWQGNVGADSIFVARGNLKNVSIDAILNSGSEWAPCACNYCMIFNEVSSNLEWRNVNISLTLPASNAKALIKHLNANYSAKAKNCNISANVLLSNDSFVDSSMFVYGENNMLTYADKTISLGDNRIFTTTPVSITSNTDSTFCDVMIPLSSGTDTSGSSVFLKFKGFIEVNNSAFCSYIPIEIGVIAYTVAKSNTVTSSVEKTLGTGVSSDSGRIISDVAVAAAVSEQAGYIRIRITMNPAMSGGFAFTTKGDLEILRSRVFKWGAALNI